MDNDNTKCPSCGAPVHIGNNMNHVVCEYCGMIISASEVDINKHKRNAQLELELQRANKSIKTRTALLSVFLVLCLGGFSAGFLLDNPGFIGLGLLTSLISMFAFGILSDAINKRDKLEKQKLS